MKAPVTTLDPGWEDAALEVVDGLPQWVRYQGGRPVAAKALTEEECLAACAYFEAQRRQGAREGFAA